MFPPQSPLCSKTSIRNVSRRKLLKWLLTNHHSACSYVDDTFVIWLHGSKTLEEFQSHLNSLIESIQFITEKEENDFLPFLDVLVTKEKNHMTISIQRNKIHTDQHLHCQSYHHPRVKCGIVLYRTNTTREEEYLCAAFVVDGYTENMAGKFPHKNNSKRPNQPEEEKTDTLFLPYV